MVENATENMQQARAAIRKGSLAEARRLLRQVVREDPYNHAAWLLLARVTPSAEAAAEYVRRAKSLSPESPLVKSARQELEEKGTVAAAVEQRSGRRTVLLLSGLIVLLGLLIGALAPLAWDHVSALKDSMPVAIVEATPAATAERAIVAMAEATATQQLAPTPTPRPTKTPEESQEATAAAEATVAAGATATVETSPTPQEEEQSGVVEETEPDDPTGLRPHAVGAAERWIDVDLTTQTLVAYEGNSPVYRTLISSGTQEYPTVVGQYRTYAKYEKQDMNGYLLGYDYYLEDVPYVMYFFGDYAIHGTYWHANFGVPMSHGCVNTSPEDAGWLFEWAPVGTTVNVHY